MSPIIDPNIALDRRRFLARAIAGIGAGAASGILGGCVPLDSSPIGRTQAQLRIIEAASGGTLGVSFLDWQSGEMAGLNRAMRFGHCSSFKTSLAALTLQRAEQNALDLTEVLVWKTSDLVPYSPFTKPRVASGASVLELARAAQELSDNSAANILLDHLGGPEALTRFWRALGDEVSRLDRNEPSLNQVPQGEVRDTTTPDAMARTLGKILFGEVLSAPHRALLRSWMVATQTGKKRVRAGLGEGWIAGDKTGTSLWPGMRSLYVDVGFVQAPGGAAHIFAAYFRSHRQETKLEARSEAVLAETGRVLRDFIARKRS